MLKVENNSMRITKKEWSCNSNISCFLIKKHLVFINWAASAISVEFYKNFLLKEFFMISHVHLLLSLFPLLVGVSFLTFRLKSCGASTYLAFFKWYLLSILDVTIVEKLQVIWFLLFRKSFSDYLSPVNEIQRRMFLTKIYKLYSHEFIYNH